MKIEDMSRGQTAIIKKIDKSHPSSFRLLEYGFTPGQEIQLINKSFFNDPLAISLRGALIAIRKSDADCIEITL